MPELPEVQTVVDTLKPKVLGKRLTGVVLHRADILQPLGFDLTRQLTARTINGIHRRGKKIVFELNGGEWFYIHLGMTGRLTVETESTPTLPHTHLVLKFAKYEVRFRDPRRFGGVFWLGRDNTADANMGPEPLQIRPAQLAKRLAKTTRAIKNALLDQSVIAGLGNIYVDESLFRAGLHPLLPANQLSADDVSRLNRAIKTTLRRALRHRGSTLRDYLDANGEAGAFQKLHAVYDREGQRCRRCKQSIQRIVLGGRSTHFCPECQPAR
ncbi:MAG TPA: bifunctional DNA-formamidopyrimidine glycosylase/DNA-(apurinic or apyrimidinic site) lyase [Tepidisphaeraceae bacterium]|nr:bifunctional DNA-formamidopyrimidine glycosylase/DNA-(apurinic or apyrimidinic site) lyase [Tepidisphaeraceae bacterium]